MNFKIKDWKADKVKITEGKDGDNAQLYNV